MKNNKTLIYSLLGMLIISILFIISMLIGMSDINFKDIIESLINYDGSKKHLIIRTIRLPRILLCILVGSSMAVSGLIMQNITRNPLASPQVLGVNAGASLAVVFILVFLPGMNYKIRIICAFLGAGFIGGLVQAIGSLKKMSPIKISLVGISIQLFLGGITKFIMIFSESKSDELVFWMVGGVHHAQFVHIKAMIPWIIIAYILGIVISKSLDVLKMGDKIAMSLGENIKRTKVLGVIIVILLSGSSVAVAGPISFIGLIVPHTVRYFQIKSFIGNLIVCGIYGGIILLASDIISRFLKYPYESPVGIVTSAIGAVFYIVLANREITKGKSYEK